MLQTQKLVERFWEKVQIGGPEDCWNWQACKNKKGYGAISINGKKELAHRVAYFLEYGIISGHLCVLHRAVDVIEIRRLYDAQEPTLKNIGAMFGVSFQMVSNIGRRINWKWLPEDAKR